MTHQFTPYPWEKWWRKLDRPNGLVLVRGTHYGCEPHSMMIQVRRQSTLRQDPVSVSIHTGTLRIRRKT